MSAKVPAETEKPREEEIEDCALEQGRIDQGGGKDDSIEDAVFGELTQDGPNYRSVRIPDGSVF